MEKRADTYVKGRTWRALIPFLVLAAPLAGLCAWAAQPTGWRWLPVLVGLYIAWVAGLLIFYVLAVFILSLTVDMSRPVPDDHPFFRRIVVHIIGLLCLFGRVRPRVTGLESVPAEGRFLLVSNHRSNYDPIVTIWAMRDFDMAFVTKPENLRIPLAGPMIYKANYLPIDRENPRHALETIGAASELLRRDVVSVGIYPEGTRSRGEAMLPFHDAVFKIAKRADVPVIVASVEGTERIHKNFPRRHTDVTVSILAVLPREEVAALSTGELSRRTRDILEAHLGRPEPEKVPVQV